jgi:hypothetical protein
MRNFATLVIAVLLSAPLEVFSSQVALLPISKFEVATVGKGDSGAIRIFGTQNAQGIDSLTVEAFGRKTNLSQKDLAQLKGLFSNGLVLSYEHLFAELGGRTVYLLFIDGFDANSDASCTVEVSESGAVRIRRQSRR